jgi:hypothetical protein
MRTARSAFRPTNVPGKPTAAASTVAAKIAVTICDQLALML